MLRTSKTTPEKTPVISFNLTMGKSSELPGTHLWELARIWAEVIDKYDLNITDKSGEFTGTRYRRFAVQADPGTIIAMAADDSYWRQVLRSFPKEELHTLEPIITAIIAGVPINDVLI